MNGKLFSKDEVNTGRQREFDYLKGAAMVLIFLIHAYQGTNSDNDAVLNAVYSFNSMSGAAFGKLFRRIGEKRQFYRIAVPVCLVIAAA